MKKILIILLCLVSFSAMAQHTNWIPFYGPARFYKQIQFINVPTLPPAPDSITIVACHDTLFISDGSWHTLWPSSSGGTFTGDTIDMPGSHDVKLYQDLGGNFLINIDGHGIYFEVVDNQSKLVINQVAVDSILVGNLWFNSARLSAGGSGNDSTIYSGSLVNGQNTAKVSARRSGGIYTVTTYVDDNTDNASITVTAGSGSSNIGLQSGTSTATLTETGFELSDSTKLNYAQANKVVVTSENRKLKTTNLPQKFIFEVYDTVFTAANATGSTPYKLVITPDLDGYELHEVKAYPEGAAGDRVPTFYLYKKVIGAAEGTAVNMMSTGANFSSGGTINPTYKTVSIGQHIKIVHSFGAGTTYPYGAILYLIFIKP